MSVEDDKRDMGDKITLHGRWSTLGEARGFCIADAPDNKTLMTWLNNWVNMCSIKVIPVLCDNKARRVILGEEPSYTVAYDRVGDAAQPGESLYFVKFSFHKDKREHGFKAFAGMTEAQDKGDAGVCTNL